MSSVMRQKCGQACESRFPVKGGSDPVNPDADVGVGAADPEEA